ncbi:transcription factor DP1, partial [Helicostylum pulchrum]
NRQIKGLRLFSKQVCDKVAEKKTTTYNEVADELAADIQRNNSHSVGIDQKNIRRRVYDALNVLMALDIITKDRKEIKWLGIHHNEQDILQQEIKNEELRQKLLIDSIQKNKNSYHDTWNNLNRLKQLVTRNHHQNINHQKIIHLPFFMIQGKADIETHYNRGNEACLSISSSFAIYQDIDILTKIWPPSSV